MYLILDLYTGKMLKLYINLKYKISSFAALGLQDDLAGEVRRVGNTQFFRNELLLI